MKLKEDEKKLLDSVEKDEWKRTSKFDLRKSELNQIASDTLKKDKRINIRISSSDLLALKSKAFEEGLPYQTFVASILHKFVKGKYQEISG